MRDGLVDLPSLGQAAGVRHVRTKFVTLLHIFIIHEVGFAVNPQKMSICTQGDGSLTHPVIIAHEGGDREGLCQVVHWTTPINNLRNKAPRQQCNGRSFSTNC